MEPISSIIDSTVFSLLSESVDDAYLFMGDLQTGYFRISKKAVDYFGLQVEYTKDVEGMWDKHVHPEDLPIFKVNFNRILDGSSDVYHCEYRAKNRFGEYCWLLCRGSVFRDANGETVLFAGALMNQGQKSKFDAITSLYSVHQFREDLHVLDTQGQRAAGLLIFGIDNFSHINERYTYSFGNEVLQIYAQEISKRRPKGSKIYRLDGDKFALIFPGASKEELKECFKVFQDTARNALSVEDLKLSISISGGGAFYPEDGKEVEVLHRNMEYALERSKQHGRKQLTFFSKEVLNVTLRKIEMIDELRKSVNHEFDGFHLCYQPIMDAKTGSLLGCEALLRWSGDTFLNVSPVEFIPILEETGDIYEVGAWVVSTALKQLKEWQSILPDLKMTVNVSYIQCSNPKFKYFVVQEVEKYNPTEGSLVLELTESCKLIDTAGLRQEMEFFEQNGIKVALDDFGTGYASVSVLRELPADWVKIDHAFVSSIVDDETDRSIIEHLISMCQKLGIYVCVEGIETELIGDIVKTYHPDCLQGYFYARPIAANVFYEKFIKQS